MINTQDTNNYNPNTDCFSANQTVRPIDVYVKIAQQCKIPCEIQGFCKKLIEIHNINSTLEHQITTTTTTNELHPKFNAWVIRVFNNVTTNEIAKLALCFDIFDEYKSNMQKTPEKIKIRVIEKLFSKYGKNTALEQLRNFGNIKKFLEDQRKITCLQSMLIATPDIEQIATHGDIVNFNCKHLDIVFLLYTELSNKSIEPLLFFLDISDSQNGNSTIDALDNIDKLMASINNNYNHLMDLIKNNLHNLLLVKKIQEIL
jgi:hypothetical protein